MVSIVNYETPGTGTGAAGETSALHSSSRGRNTDYVTVDYGSIAGEDCRVGPCFARPAGQHCGPSIELGCGLWQSVQSQMCFHH